MKSKRLYFYPEWQDKDTTNKSLPILIANQAED